MKLKVLQIINSEPDGLVVFTSDGQKRVISHHEGVHIGDEIDVADPEYNEPTSDPEPESDDEPESTDPATE